MPYNNTPLANETPATSQPLMQQNFNQIATSYNTDHVPLTSLVNVGQHKQVTLANSLANDPNQVSPITSIYAKNNQLFFQNGNSASNAIQITGQNVLESGNDGLGGSYNVFQLPFGMRLFTGFTNAFNGTYNGVFSGVQTFGAAIYTALATPSGTATTVSFQPTASTKTFTMKDGALTNVFWMVLSN